METGSRPGAASAHSRNRHPRLLTDADAVRRLPDVRGVDRRGEGFLEERWVERRRNRADRDSRLSLRFGANSPTAIVVADAILLPVAYRRPGVVNRRP